VASKAHDRACDDQRRQRDEASGPRERLRLAAQQRLDQGRVAVQIRRREQAKLQALDGLTQATAARQLADEAPLYSREAAPKKAPEPLDLASVPETDPLTALETLLAHPSIASKQWVWQQYDHMVRLGATVLPGSDAAVFIVREANKILAASTDCNAIYCKQDPREGGRIAVAEAARNIACTGATPLAVTDNLNFGNPHKPENFLQLREAIEGLAEACRAFDTPVTGGNVSLYNESPAGAIDPTPTVGMVGLVEKPEHITTQAFKAAGDIILLIGEPGHELGASHYLLAVHGRKAGAPPQLDYAKELAVQNAVRDLIRKGLVKSAHDCSEGGLAVNLAESCLSGNLGAKAEIPGTRADVALFNESQSRIVITFAPRHASEILDFLKSRSVPHTRLGEVTNDPTLTIEATGKTFSWPLEKLRTPFEKTIPSLMSWEK
jgi:phosphoribosylformylglycinamidine synthase